MKSVLPAGEASYGIAVAVPRRGCRWAKQMPGTRLKLEFMICALPVVTGKLHILLSFNSHPSDRLLLCSTACDGLTFLVILIHVVYICL